MKRNFEEILNAYEKHLSGRVKDALSNGSTLLQQAYDAGLADGAMNGIPWNEDKTAAPYRIPVMVTTLTINDDEDEEVYSVAMGRRISSGNKSGEWLVGDVLLDDDDIVAWTDAIKPYMPKA